MSADKLATAPTDADMKQMTADGDSLSFDADATARLVAAGWSTCTCKDESSYECDSARNDGDACCGRSRVSICNVADADAVVPAQPFADCPGLRLLATMQCPSGKNYAMCVSDAGFTCDLLAAVAAWTVDKPLGDRPTPPPTPGPTRDIPDDVAFCDMVYCRHEEHKCAKFNKDMMTWASPSKWITEFTEIELMDQPHDRKGFDPEECNGNTRRSVRVYHHRDESRCTKLHGGHRCGVGLISGDMTKCECGPKFDTKPLHHAITRLNGGEGVVHVLDEHRRQEGESIADHHERLFSDHDETHNTPMRDFKGGYDGDRPTHLVGGYVGSKYNDWGCNLEGQRLSANATISVVFDHIPRGWCRRFQQYTKTTQKDASPCARFHHGGGEKVTEFGGAAVKLLAPTTVGVMCAGAGAKAATLFETDGDADQAGTPWDTTSSAAVYWHEEGKYQPAGGNGTMHGFEGTVPAGNYTVCCAQSDDTDGFTSGAFTSERHNGTVLEPLFTTLLHPDEGTAPAADNVVTYRNNFAPDAYIAGGKGSADERNPGSPWKRGDHLYWDTTAVGRANLDGGTEVAHPKIVGCEDKLWQNVGTKEPFYECAKYFGQKKI